MKKEKTILIAFNIVSLAFKTSHRLIWSFASHPAYTAGHKYKSVVPNCWYAIPHCPLTERCVSCLMAVLGRATCASQSEEVIASNRCASTLSPGDFCVLWSLPNLWRPVVSHESSVTRNKLPAHWTGHNNKRCHYFHGNWSHLRREKSIVNIIVSGVEAHIEEVWFVMHAAYLLHL